MIKVVVALFVFAVLLCFWIVDPFGWASADTRAAAAAPAPSDRLGQEIVPSSPETDAQVTRSIATVDELPVPQPAVTAEGSAHGLRTYDAPLEATIAGILTRLGLDAIVVQVAGTDESADTSGADPLANQLADTLAGIATVTGAERSGATVGTVPGPGVDAAAALADIVAEALRQGRDDADIEADVNRAAEEGEIAVPGVLIRADGGVDAEVLLQGILITVRIAQGDTVDGVWSERLSGDDAILHEVVAGQSLAGLALGYYGNPSLADRILAANADTLDGRSGTIAPGQRLVIPRL